MKRPKVLSLLSLILPLLALGGIVWANSVGTQSRREPPESRPEFPPSQRVFSQTLSCVGIVESANRNVLVAPPVAGVVETVAVEVGQVVKEGAILFQLDSREADAEVATLQTRVAVAEARLAEAEVVLAAENDLYERSAKLEDRGSVSTEEFRRRKYAREAARQAVRRISADLDQVRSELAAAKTSRDLLTIRAPRNGTLLQVDVREGEHISPESPTVILGDLASLQVTAEVEETDVPRLRPGCLAVAHPKGNPGMVIPLEFLRIEPLMSPKRSLTGESSERVDTRVLPVVFRIQDPPKSLYPGQLLEIVIEETGSSEGASNLPTRGALNF